MAAAVQTDPLEESQAPQQTNSGKIAPIKRQSVTSGQLPHAQQQQASPLWHVALKPSLIVLGGGTAVYTLIFFVALICIGVGNLVTYGPIPTSYTTATIHGQPARIITSNDHGDITVTVKIQQKDGTLLVRSYAGPALNPDTWNGNLNTVVATSQVGSDGQTIIVHLIGEVNYFHPFLVRPAQDFSLIPDKQAGYKISA